MRKFFFLAAAMLAAPSLVLVLIVLPEPAGAITRSGCPKEGKTVLRTKEARLFTRGGLTAAQGFNGCLLPTGRAYRVSLLDDYGVSVNANLIRLSGRFAAISQNIGAVESGPDRVVVRNLANGHVRYLGPRGTFGLVRDLVVKRNGSVAFIYAERTTQVYVVTRAGQRLVDEGPGIDETSLELDVGRTAVTYTKFGEGRSIPIE